MEKLEISFSREKNKELMEERGISFETIVHAILEDRILDTYDHPNKNKYGGQKIYILEIDGYAWVVPYVEEKDHIFLKTAFPSRKATKHYLKENLL